MTRVCVSPNVDALSLAAADEFARIAVEAVAARETCAVALAGGSTPRQLYQTLAHADAVRARVPWDRIEFFWGDERHVPPDHPDSNFRMANEALFASAPVAPAQIHRIHAEAADAATAASDYEAEILTTLRSKSGIPSFDLVLLGLGTDGHTASLFPGTPALVERHRICVANWVGALGVHRITITLPLINAARAVMFVVSGVDKASIVRDVLQPDASRPALPAQLVRPRGDLLWMLDDPAATRVPNDPAEAQVSHRRV
jgi:6-phosphogluconolactonase